ncbi:MAG: competence protein ComEA [Solirubrobacterales bacterium]|jgi:competence ComEA-like helix-hairpin-helix protein|nr:competence protein ComEA [Solirubrobacterales bacterium]
MRRILLVLFSLALCAGGPPAAAQAKSTDEVINLAPARAEGALARGISVGPFTLSNRMREDYDVTVFPTLLGQRRDGSLFARSDPAARASARRLLAEQVRAFPLAPGAARSVLARVKRVPSGGRGLYATLVFRATPARLLPAQSIRNVFQLNASLLLDPRRALVRFHAGAIRTEQAGPGLRSFVPVRNTGTGIAPVGGRLVVRDAAGAVVTSVRMATQRILPGAVVDLAAPLRTGLPRGAYTIQARLQGGRRDASAQGALRLFATDHVATRAARIATFGTPTAYRGEDVEIAGRFRNAGNVAFAPRGVVEITRLGDDRPLRRVALRVDRAAPGKLGSFSAKLALPGAARSYGLTVRLLDGPRELDERTTSVGVVDRPPLSRRVQDAITRHAVPLVVLLLLALVGAAAALLLRRPVRAPAAAGERRLLDLNLASAAELELLPGIGRAMAQRIVAQREEHGPFGSLDDLAAVRGFGAGRIEALRDRATVTLSATKRR